MAIKGYNAGVEDTSSVPQVDVTAELQNGDMLYFDKANNVFRGGPGIVLPTKVSELQNDREFITEYQLSAAIANAALDGDNIDFNDFASIPYVDSKFQEAKTLAESGHFSGDYNDLTNKPALFSGDYNDLANKPVYPDTSNFLTQAQIDILMTDKLLDIPLFSGDYNDLANKPTIPSVDGLASTSYVVQHIDNLQDQIDALPSNVSAFVNDALYSTISYVDQQVAAVQSGGQIDLTGYVTDAELASELAGLGAHFSGNYNDLTNKPTIPSLTGYATELYVQQQVNQIEQFSGDYNDLTNKPAIPSLAGYATQAYVDAQIPDVTDLVTQAELTNGLADKVSNVHFVNSIANFISETEIDSKIASAVTGGTVDLSDYVTDTELATELANLNIPADISDLTDTTNLLGSGSGNVDLSNYYTKTEVDGLIPNTFSGDYNDLINQPTIPDVSTFISETAIDSKIASAVTGGTVDLSDYVTETELATELANYQPSVDLTAYYTKTEVDGLIPTVPTDISQLTDTTNLLSGSGGGNVDLTGYATETYVNQQIASASIGGIANIDDLNDVAIGSLPQSANASEHYLLEYNPVTSLWESNDFGNIFATQSYVSATVATALTNGTINLDGYATEQFVEQKLTERGDHFSGNYFDLTNRPQLFSGDYNDLLNKPAGNQDLRMLLVGQELQLINIEPEPDTVISSVDLSALGAAIGNNISYSDLSNLPNLFSGDYGDLVNRPTLFSGNYNDLANKPYIPSIAGLATEQYVDNRWAEPVITGDRFYTNDIEFRGKTTIVQSTADTQAKKSDYVFAVQTTDGTDVEVSFSDGTFISLADNTTAKVSATYVCTSGSTHSSFTINGIVHKHGGNLVAIGNNNIEITEDSGQGWTADIDVDTVNDRIKFTVQGSISTTVDWVIFVEITEVTA